MKYVLSLALVLCLQVGQSQIFGRIMDRAVDKAMDKAEDRLVDAASEALARQLYKPIDRALDSMLYQSYQSTAGDSMDYAGFLTSLDVSDKLPDSYAFDVEMTIEVTDNKDKNDMIMLLSKGGECFGMRQPDEDGNPLIIMDYKNGIIAMYQEGKDGKTVTAMPNMISQYAASTAIDVEMDKQEVTFEKTSKTKKILGYTCDEYRFESKTDKGKAYSAADFPVDWSDAFGKMLGQLSSETIANKSVLGTGMLLYSESKAKKGKDRSKWDTKKVDLDGVSVITSDYKIMNMASYED